MTDLRILAIVGSPRNEESYTYKALQLIEKKMNAIQPTAVEYIFLQKVALPFCNGCVSYCIKRSEETCPEYEIVGAIVEKVEKSDGLILASPVHTCNVAGLMKNFCEYLMYKRMRPSFFGTKAVVFATASGGGHRVVLDFLESQASSWGCDVVTRMGISSSQMHKPTYLDRVDASAQDVAHTFVQAISHPTQQSPKFNQLMNFKAMQTSTERAKETKNYAYWDERGWLQADYYTDVPLNPLYNATAKFIASRIRKAIRTGNVKPIR